MSFFAFFGPLYENYKQLWGDFQMKALTVATAMTLICAFNVSARENVKPFVTLEASKFNAQLELYAMQGDKKLAGPPLNEIFSVHIEITGGENSELPGSLKFDARMPAHNHGMIVRPTVERVGASVFRVDGVKLHMPGDWEIVVELVKGEKKETVRSGFLQRVSSS